MAVYQQAISSGNPDLAAEAMIELAHLKDIRSLLEERHSVYAFQVCRSL